MQSAIPHLRRHGTATQLVVDGSPFLIIGGELHNSTASSLEYLSPLWECLVAAGLNTVLLPASWELIEPVEGVFDFALVDGLIREARRRGLRLIFLWFGSWKNGMSSYVPAWIKRDYTRFPRVRRQNGHAVEVLSAMSQANREADATAFAALMRHLREVDRDHHTVIMVQVENEVGVLGDSRDRSDLANTMFDEPVPQELLAELARHRSELSLGLRERWETNGARQAGNWEHVFGSGPETDEVFMAWHYARYLDQVAVAGKAEYDLPMFVNAWLTGPEQAAGDFWPSGGKKPGDWPSGGPLPHTLDVWLAGAPHLDLLAPDIYFGDFREWCRKYTRRGNPLFIPETRRDEEGARNVWYAIGQYDAIGTSPFAVDSLDDPANSPLNRSYGLLRQLAPLILEHQGMGTIAGVLLDDEHPSMTVALGGYELDITLDSGFGATVEHGYGLIIATEQDTFVGAGYGFRVSFRPISPHPMLAGISAVEEGQFRHGNWIRGRRLNGDETASGKWWRFPAPGNQAGIIPTLGAGSGIARCTVYQYE